MEPQNCLKQKETIGRKMEGIGKKGSVIGRNILVSRQLAKTNRTLISNNKGKW